MHLLKLFVAMFVAFILVGCATTYTPRGGGGGYQERRINDNFYRLTFVGNGSTTQETVQTYWLYRAAELAIEKGYDGFEITSSIAFVAAPLDSPYRRTQLVFIPMALPKAPSLEADILLLKLPFAPSPPKVFDAKALLSELHTHVKGERKCDSGNVCPHFKGYLRPAAAEIKS